MTGSFEISPAHNQALFLLHLDTLIRTVPMAARHPAIALVLSLAQPSLTLGDTHTRSQHLWKNSGAEDNGRREGLRGSRR